MKSRKGNFETVALAVVTFMLVGVIASLSSAMLVDTNGIIRSESMDLAAMRMERAIYGISAMEDIKLQLDYGRYYGLYREDRTTYISYTFNNEEHIQPLDTPVNYQIREPAEDHRVRYFCLNKTSQASEVLVYAGKC